MVWSIAHRGARGYEPENTELAIRKALELGADIIEIDVQRTKDKHLVLVHDERVWNKYRYVSIRSQPLENLRKLKLKKAQRILTLQEALDVINKRAVINIDVKGKGDYLYLYRIIMHYVLHKKWKYSQFIVSSMHKDDLLKLRRLNPRIQIGLTYYRAPKHIDKVIQTYHPYSIHLYFVSANKNIAQKLRERNVKFFVWTINSRKLINKMRKFNVDGICTDYPDRI